jgi:hypothetical protein
MGMDEQRFKGKARRKQRILTREERDVERRGATKTRIDRKSARIENAEEELDHRVTEPRRIELTQDAKPQNK